jgi:murein DD-endopeptidase MepM/ murein hydrolase activator NlpD
MMCVAVPGVAFVSKRPAKRPRRRLQFTLTVSQTVTALMLFGLVILWSAVVTGYIVFRDDVLVQLAVSHKSMQADYEDRIAELRRAMEELRTAGLAEKATLSAKLDALVQLQAELQERQNAMAAIVGVSPGAPVPAAQESMPAAASSPKPRPISDSPEPNPRISDHRGRDPLITGSLGRWGAPRRSLGAQFETIETGYHRLEAAQENLLATLETRTNMEKTSLELVYARIGVPPSDDQAPRGGPFLEPPSGDASDQRIARISLARAEVAGLRSGLSTLPIAMPAPAEDVTSDFGTRMDPFLGRPAFHSGIDFKAAPGTPVRATASGRVADAGRNGGYGLMVEVAHRHGLSTRYGHLSAIAVQEGMLIDAGQIIGYVGSTGRSTGPHLHYETRRAGEALNPVPFLEAGRIAGAIR